MGDRDRDKQFYIKKQSSVTTWRIQIETKNGEKNEQMDLSAVLLTDSTLMPDTKMSVVNKDKVEDDKETVNEILEDLKRDLKRASGADGEKVEKSFVNSFITEIDVADPPQDFKLNLFIKPIIDIVSQRENEFLV